MCLNQLSKTLTFTTSNLKPQLTMSENLTDCESDGSGRDDALYGGGMAAVITVTVALTIVNVFNLYRFYQKRNDKYIGALIF